jgi:osmotically-inducible protein OsmY
MTNETDGDATIKENIEAHLCWDSCLETSGVDVEVKDGSVVLKGSVPSLRSRAAAEEDARSIRGVREIRNLLIVEPELEAGDDEITSAVRNILDWTSDIDAAGIRVQARKGIVLLQGSVETFWEKQLASEIAADVIGVRDVINELSVDTPISDADPDIEQEIILAVGRSSAFDETDISVKVNKGHVTLTGRVPTWDSYVEADEIAQHTDGVTGVTNRLTVE